jgi:hypothetical protein
MSRPETIVNLENDELRFDLASDASGEILVKRTGVRWRHGPVAIQHEGPLEDDLAWFRGDLGIQEVYPGRFRLTPHDHGVRGTLLDRFGEPVGDFLCRYELSGGWIDVEIEAIDDSIPSLIYPTPIESGALVLPQKAGAIVTELPHRFTHTFYRYAGQRLNMRWFGGLDEPAGPGRGCNGWLALVDAGDADAGMMHAGRLNAPGWMRSLDRWTSPRRLRYGFTDDGYVGLAKLFRGWARERGVWHGLDEKIDANPKTRLLVGGRGLGIVPGYREERSRFEDRWLPVPDEVPDGGRFVVNATFAEARSLAEEAVAAGMRRGMFKFDGWSKGGYDERHPDVWPPAAELGTVEEFESMVRREGDFITCLHDNYQDIYANTPDHFANCCKRRDGKPLTGGFWHGGQAFIADARKMLPFATANADRALACGAGAVYIDNWGGELLRQSWEEGNLLSRSADREAKIAILEMMRAKGIIVASEDGCDWIVAHSEWAPKGKYTRDAAGSTVPLWSLVFHDAQVGRRPVDAARQGGADPNSVRRACMDNMLWGFASVFRYTSLADFRRRLPLFRETLFTDEWHARIGMSELVRHSFLTEDCLVEQSEFANGAAITCNYADDEREADGVVLPPLGYVVRG